MGDDVIAWIAEVQQAIGPGPATVIGLSVDGREPFRLELVGHEPGERAERLVSAVARWLRTRPTATIEAVARDAQNAIVDRYPLGGGARDAAILASSAGSSAAAPGWDKLLDHAMATGREYSRIGIEATERATKAAALVIDRLDRENSALRARVAQLEESVSSTWELRRRMAEEAAESQARAEREAEVWKVGSTAVRAALARFAGVGGGAAVRSDLLSETLESLRPDQLERILTVLDDSQRIAVFEAIGAARKARDAAPSSSSSAPSDPILALARSNAEN